MLYFTPLEGMSAMEPMKPMQRDVGNMVLNTDKASFLDIFRGLIDNVIETNEQVDRDSIDIMLGNVDDIATIQANMEKANTAVDVLVAVKNEAISAYNSIINMQI